MSTSEQLANYLREEIRSGRLSGDMPGIKQLVRRHGVNSVTATKAVRQLEHDGMVVARGERSKRLIKNQIESRYQSLRIGLLYYDRHNHYRTDALELRQSIIDSGHTPVVATKSIQDLGKNVQRIIRHVNSIEVDAWVVYAGPADLLQWFAKGDIPAFAIYGRMTRVNLAGMAIRRIHLLEMLVAKLVALGHQRIVMIVREERRKPQYGLPERFFLEQLEANGIPTGPYNIPDWEETPEGLEQCLDKLFAHTPPTAMLIDDAVLFHSIQTQLARHGINAPENISLICHDYNESFEWTRPDISHIYWDYLPTIRRAMQWIKNISKGIDDRRRSYTNAKFHEGGTIAPPPSSRKK